MLISLSNLADDFGAACESALPTRLELSLIYQRFGDQYLISMTRRALQFDGLG